MHKDILNINIMDFCMKSCFETCIVKKHYIKHFTCLDIISGIIYIHDRIDYAPKFTTSDLKLLNQSLSNGKKAL